MKELDMEVVVAKIISLVILTILTVLTGLCPLRILMHAPHFLSKNRQTIEYFLCGLRCFSGGIFLATCFLHLLPDTRNKIQVVMRNMGSRSTYAVPELLIMAGFYGIVFVDQFIKWMYVKASEAERKPKRRRKKSLPIEDTLGLDHMEMNVETTSLRSDGNQDRLSEDLHINDRVDETTIKDTLDSDIEPAPFQDIEVNKVVSEFTKADYSNKGHVRLIIYITALSFHGVFEGMTLGLQSVESNVWSLCFAICAHRCVLAFKLGMDLCNTEEKQGTAWLCIGTFTLISALGIVIGIVISSGAMLYADVTVPEAILQSLATGTIFYIVFFDILFKDLQGKDDMKRIGCSFVGFVLMAVVFAITMS
ncbi:zinc transporter ZIP3-like [Haliotis cracherodii]|uniref:zinc transporter ZIP3-like n=1 Tax=Haliotis cracherodii TaxID=6455 RepID=UPI0039E89014